MDCTTMFYGFVKNIPCFLYLNAAAQTLGYDSVIDSVGTSF